MHKCYTIIVRSVISNWPTHLIQMYNLKYCQSDNIVACVVEGLNNYILWRSLRTPPYTCYNMWTSTFIFMCRAIIDKTEKLLHEVPAYLISADEKIDNQYCAIFFGGALNSSALTLWSETIIDVRLAEGSKAYNTRREERCAHIFIVNPRMIIVSLQKD